MREHHVFLGPLHHALGGVDVDDFLRAGCGAGHGGAAGVGEQVEHADLSVGAGDLLHHEIPVGRLLGEEPGVLEAGRADLEAELAVTNVPAFRQLFQVFPVSAAFGGTMIAGMGLQPEAAFLCDRPQRQRVGAPQDDVLPAFELFSVSGIDAFVIFPAGCDLIHGVSLLFFRFLCVL